MGEPCCYRCAEHPELKEHIASLEARLSAAEEREQVLRREIEQRRECLVGAKETLRMVAAVLENAPGVPDVVRSYGAPVAERIDLVDQAIANGDEALATASGEGESQ